MKKILGLDLGTTSIGWAFVHEAENIKEQSKIVKIGVRVNPLSTDESKNFTEGQSLTTNAGRTEKRHARRNRHRFHLRRSSLKQLLAKLNWIGPDARLTETGPKALHETYRLRAKSTLEKITKEELARVLLMINKKRGYKSSRKVKNTEDEGQLMDDMNLAIHLQTEGKTPGQYAFELLSKDAKSVPIFYKSDLQDEFNRVWENQKSVYPNFLTDDLKERISGKTKTVTARILYTIAGIETVKNVGAGKKLQAYEWRSKAITESLDSPEILAYVIAEINGNISNSSGYLGAISDRSKKLYFKNQTVGQYQYDMLVRNPHQSLKNQVFYRQDYLDEFERIWLSQSRFYPDLTEDLKSKIQKEIIFYQRPLKSQKGLISFCEFEFSEVKVDYDGKKVKKIIGSRVAPRSSPLFQEFKIWQNLSNLRFKLDSSGEIFLPTQSEKQRLFDELNISEKLSSTAILKLIYNKDHKEYTCNYNQIDGNKTNHALYQAYYKIFDLSAAGSGELQKKNASDQKDLLKSFFEEKGIDSSVLDFDAEVKGQTFIRQKSYQLWHLLYSYEGDNSKTGLDALLEKLKSKYGFNDDQARIMANISFMDDYGSLSAKALRKIMPFIREHMYSDACDKAGYNHSSSITREENLKRILKKRLDPISKNSLRNPVVEKILNQMINVIHAILDHPEMGYPDEIRIELARELKQSAKEREEAHKGINEATRKNDVIRKLLQEEPFSIKHPSRNDIIRYRLYKELEHNMYNSLYTNRYIPQEKLFSQVIQVEHIIPKALVFDDSFSNKTLAYHAINNKKDKQTAIDFVSTEYGDKGLDEYKARIEYALKCKAIGKSKYRKLLKEQTDLDGGFIERDLRNTQYIAKKARQMLLGICYSVVPTTGKITDRLRNDWDLINVLKELNMPKYRALGLTSIQERRHGHKIEVIDDWTKRNDHRHHAVDALVVAFTKHGHIQYLNNLHADSNKSRSITGLEESLMTINNDQKRVFAAPLPNFRQKAKRHLESVLISRKAKNKVVTRNINKTGKKGKKAYNKNMELTPRGQLHKETIYGSIRRYVAKQVSIGSKTTEMDLKNIVDVEMRDQLLTRLSEYNGDAKKAFTGKNSLSRNPILTKDGKPILSKVKIVSFETIYTIRKDITPGLRIDKVIDEGVKKVLKTRLDSFNGDKKKAFSDLEENPIWLNKAKGICIKRVTITGVSKVEALHDKKDHFGKEILDKSGMTIPVDFVSTGNNHHVGIYRDEKGKLREKVVSFFEATQRVNAGLPTIDRDHNSNLGWKLEFTMKQNEYFVFPGDDFHPETIDLLNPNNATLISPHLFRVQKISKKEYLFNQHLETTAITGEDLKNKKILRGKTHYYIQSTPHLEGLIKVRLDHLGRIVHIGEY